MKNLVFLLLFFVLPDVSYGRGGRSLTAEERIERNTRLLKTETNQSKRSKLIEEIEELESSLSQSDLENIFDQTLPRSAGQTSDEVLCKSLCQLAKNQTKFNSSAVKGPMGRDSMQRTIEGMQLNLFEELKDALPCVKEGAQIGEESNPCKETLKINQPIQDEHRRLTQNVLNILRAMPESDTHTAARNKRGGGNDVVQGEVYQKIHLILTLEKIVEKQPNNDNAKKALTKLKEELTLDQQQFYSRQKGGWGSLMNTYATSVALISNDEPFSRNEMETLAHSLKLSNASQKVPYTMGSSAPDRSERASSARNTTFYMGLYLNGRNGKEHYRDSFVESIETYQENLNSLMGHMLKDDAHTGSDQLGSYYFYSTFPYVTSGIKILLEDPKTTSAQKQKLEKIQTDLKNQILRVFDDKSGLFKKSGWYSGDGSRTWVNPLLAMGMLPLIKNCGSTKVDSYGIMPKSLIERSKKKSVFCTVGPEVIQLEEGLECPRGSRLSTYTDLQRIENTGHKVLTNDELQLLMKPETDQKTRESLGRLENAPRPLPVPQREEKECIKLEDLIQSGVEIDESTKIRLIEFLNRVNGDHCQKY